MTTDIAIPTQVVIGIIITAILGFILNRLIKVLNLQESHGLDLVKILGVLNQNTMDIKSLQEWRNKVTEKEIERLEKEAEADKETILSLKSQIGERRNIVK